MMKKLTFAFDCELNDLEFIPEGTIVEVYPHRLQRKDSTWIVYNGESIEFMNCAFVEYKKVGK